MMERTTTSILGPFLIVTSSLFNSFIGELRLYRFFGYRVIQKFSYQNSLSKPTHVFLRTSSQDITKHWQKLSQLTLTKMSWGGGHNKPRGQLRLFGDGIVENKFIKSS